MISGKVEMDQRLQIVRNLLQLGAYLQKAGNRLAKEFGLTQQQFVVLNEVAEYGPVNQTHVAGQLLAEKSNVSKIANKLATEGLIDITVSMQDARTTLLSITPKGREVWKAGMQRLNHWSLAKLGGMGPNEIDQSLLALNQLKKHFVEKNHQFRQEEKTIGSIRPFLF